MTGHTLSNTPCAMADWLSMAIMSGLAFGIGLLLLLAIAALAKYVFDHSRWRVN